jgi:ankyrin repeat protein
METKSLCRSISQTAGPQLASIEDKIDHIRWSTPASAADRKLNCIRNLFATDQAVVRSGLKTTKGRVVSGTCDWVLDDCSYQRWLDSDTKYLWISGGPGMGKTMLSIYLSEHLERCRPDQSDAVIYFFCDARGQHQNTAVSVLRGLMYQLVHHKSDLVNCLLDEYDVHKEQLFKHDMFEKLWIIFLEMVTQLRPSKTFCIIDGLDECQPDSLHQLLTKMKLLGDSEPEERQLAGLFKGIILSRHHPTSIRSTLGTALRIQLDGVPESGLSGALQSSGALVRYVSVAVDELGRATNKNYPEELSNKVKMVLLERSAGTYLWVSFIIRELQEKETSEVEECIQQLPSGLDDLYGRIVSQFRPDRLEQIRELLEWCLLTKEPLSLAALVDALGIKATESLSAIQILHDRVAYCRNLLVIAGDRVRTYHQSVEDYLCGRPDSASGRPWSELVPFDKPQGYARLTMRCLDYLKKHLKNSGCSEAQKEVVGTGESPPPRSFLHYAMNFWPYHMRESGAAMLTIADAHEDFFCEVSDIRAKWYAWTWRREDLLRKERRLPPPVLHLFACMGLDGLLARMLTSRRVRLRLNSRFRSTGGLFTSTRTNVKPVTPLLCAIQGGWPSTCELLLAHGADPNVAAFTHTSLARKEPIPMTPLIYAIHRGPDPNRLLIVTKLISAGARVNGVRSRTSPLTPPLRPLCEAVSTLCPDLELVQLLINSGADPAKRDDRGYWPLRAMLDTSPLTTQDSVSLRDIMKYLLSQYRQRDFVSAAISTDGQSKGDDTLVHWAAKVGDSELVRRLIEDWHLSPCSENERGMTPMDYAVEYGNLEVAEALLREWKVPLNPGGLSATSAAWHAVISGQTRILKLLIDDYGVDPNDGLSGPNVSWTLLHHAADSGQAEVVDVLLSRGADPNPFTATGTRHGYTCQDFLLRDFIFRARKSPYNYNKLEGLDDVGSVSPLYLAIMGGYTGMVESFLAHGVDPNLPCRRCCRCRPIHIAAWCGREDIVRLLRERYGIDLGTTSKDPSGLGANTSRQLHPGGERQDELMTERQ